MAGDGQVAGLKRYKLLVQRVQYFEFEIEAKHAQQAMNFSHLDAMRLGRESKRERWNVVEIEQCIAKSP